MAAAPKIQALQDDLNDEATEKADVVYAPVAFPWLTTTYQAIGSVALMGPAMLSTNLVQMGPSIQISDDFHGWLLDQAAALRDQRFFSLDLEHLAEELEDMAAQQRREVKKHLKKLLLHLLKFKAQPEERARHHSWRKSIREAREDISDLLEDSPGVFQGKREEFVAQAYKRARADAVDETAVPPETFLESCPWSFHDFMRDDFYPGVNS